MKKTNFRHVLAVAAVSCFIAVPTYAAETKEEYREAVAVIRQEIDDVTGKLDTVRKENEDWKNQYMSIQQTRKGGQELPEGITEEEWQKAKELRQKISDLREVNPETKKGKPAEGEKKNSATKAAVQSGDYDAAITAQRQRLEEKQASLEYLLQVNEIWKQIDELLK